MLEEIRYLDIGENFARYRIQKEWTQAELTKATGLSQGYIAAIEQGRRRSTLKTLAVIVRVKNLIKEDNRE